MHVSSLAYFAATLVWFSWPQVGTIRQHLADIYEREQNWRQAASVLVGIPLETGQKQYSVDYKLETYLKIARLYLEDEDPVQGEAYINRAAQLQTQTKNQTLIVSWKYPFPEIFHQKPAFPDFSWYWCEHYVDQLLISATMQIYVHCGHRSLLW